MTADRERSLRLFHVSDLHFGKEDRAALAWFAGRVQAERPDGVIVSGDLTMRARHREFAAAQQWLNALAAPVVVGIGNHDLPYFNPLERIATPYRRFRKLAENVGRKEAARELGIVFLKTTARWQWRRLNWSKGRVTQAALKRSLAQLDALPRGARAIVCAHHPLAEPGTAGTAHTTRGPAALDALARRGIIAVLSGHVHDPFDMTVDTVSGPVRMIGAGTLSERLRDTPPSFNELTLEGGELSNRVREMEYPNEKPAGAG